MNELTLPLRDVIKRAAQRDITGPAARIQERLRRSTDTTVLLCDVSVSMMDHVAGLRKIDHLRVAVRDLYEWNQGRGKIVILCFSTGCQRVDWDKIPEPCGGTDLAYGLMEAGKFNPRRTVIVSDGEPDNPAQAQEAAAEISGVIDIVYCGPEHARGAEFMRGLARDSGGRSVVWDEERPRLAENIRGLLTAG